LFPPLLNFNLLGFRRILPHRGSFPNEIYRKKHTILLSVLYYLHINYLIFSSGVRCVTLFVKQIGLNGRQVIYLFAIIHNMLKCSCCKIILQSTCFQKGDNLHGALRKGYF
jgi:hypothetical protein